MARNDGRVAGTVNFDHIVRHYHYSHETVNPHRIIPINPILDWDEPHGRGRTGEGGLSYSSP